jgi:hypothetical protein
MYTQAFMSLAGIAPAPQTFSQPIDIGAAYVTPPLGRIFRVCGDGTTVTNLDDAYSALSTNMERRSYASVAAALAECKSGRGDVIYVAPGHTETITATSWTSALVAGVQIIGLGQGTTRPTFTFAVAGATVAVSVAGVTFRNCRFICDGTAATTVTAGFTVTGEGCDFIDNYFHVGTSNTQKCATLLTVSAANCRFINNVVIGDTAATLTTTIIALGTATTGADGFVCTGNFIKAAAAATTTGVIKNITQSGTATNSNIKIVGNYLHNLIASSTVCISFAGNAVTTGVVANNYCRTEVGGAGGISPVTYAGTGVDLALFQNYCNNLANGNGALVVGAGTST